MNTYREFTYLKAPHIRFQSQRNRDAVNDAGSLVGDECEFTSTLIIRGAIQPNIGALETEPDQEQSCCIGLLIFGTDTDLLTGCQDVTQGYRLSRSSTMALRSTPGMVTLAPS